jgi:hypothetical protein
MIQNEETLYSLAYILTEMIDLVANKARAFFFFRFLAGFAARDARDDVISLHAPEIPRMKQQSRQASLVCEASYKSMPDHYKFMPKIKLACLLQRFALILYRVNIKVRFFS